MGETTPILQRIYNLLFGWTGRPTDRVYTPDDFGSRHPAKIRRLIDDHDATTVIRSPRPFTGEDYRYFREVNMAIPVFEHTMGGFHYIGLKGGVWIGRSGRRMR